MGRLIFAYLNGSCLAFSLVFSLWSCREVQRYDSNHGGVWNRFFRQLAVPFSLGPLRYSCIYFGLPEVAFIINAVFLMLPVFVCLVGVSYLIQRTGYIASRAEIPELFESRWLRIYHGLLVYTVVSVVLQLVVRSRLGRAVHIISALVLGILFILLHASIVVKLSRSIDRTPEALRKLLFGIFCVWVTAAFMFYGRITAVMSHLKHHDEDYFDFLRGCYRTTQCFLDALICVICFLITTYLGFVPKKYRQQPNKATTLVKTPDTDIITSIPAISSINPMCWTNSLSKSAANVR